LERLKKAFHLPKKHIEAMCEKLVSFDTLLQAKETLCFYVFKFSLADSADLADFLIM